MSTQQSHEEKARELLIRSFEEYQRWQNGTGDWDTFLDWIRDELEDLKKESPA